MDFYKIRERESKKGNVVIFPDFKVKRSEDLMIRSKAFYAIWDEQKGMWSTDEFDVARLVDADLWKYKHEVVEPRGEGICSIADMSSFSSKTWKEFRSYMMNLSDSSTQLDTKLTFANTKVTKKDHVSKRLPYSLEEGDIRAWDELVSTLYDPEEREKIEWCIGAVVAGEAKDLQKFAVFYGAPGTGKGTIINIIAKLFAGYYTTFEAAALTSSNNTFATEAFKSNPLVAIQHDGDLSKIEDNTKLNSIVSHEEMTINEKHKPTYTSKINAFLFLGTNKPVKISDAKSGLIRRLIDIHPAIRRIPPKKYESLMAQIDFELGAIAHHCLMRYRDLGKNYYNSYKPVEMMLETNAFYNFIEEQYHLFKSQDGVSVQQAYNLYKVFCEDSNIQYPLSKQKLRGELQNYFEHFEERATLEDGTRVRSWYSGFKTETFKSPVEEEAPASLVMDETESLLDEMYKDQPAQYANQHETPSKRWAEVETKLSDLDSTQLHYVKPLPNHIVIDFDIKDDTGEKSAELNIEAAAKWPSTYAEYSKSGHGVHLHYIWEGDVSELSYLFSEGIEVKVFTGDSSLRRKLSLCNGVPIATISTGLPLKEKKVINAEKVKSEKALRDLVNRNLRKEIHPSTKSSIDFIAKILKEAYESDLIYDLSDMKQKTFAFAMGSTNQAQTCIKTVMDMQWKSEDQEEEVEPSANNDERGLVFFDVEVFPNLFVICWKYQGSDTVVKMINPTGPQVEELCVTKLVGYNCRRYDNHILYAAVMGYTVEQLYRLSKKIINSHGPGALFGEAYGLSYADIYDFASTKQTLKKWEIDLGIKHNELGLDWDKPVPDELVDKVVEYCADDVNATELVFEHLKQDFVARQILADLSGLSVNDTTQKHTAKIVFNGEKNPQKDFVYTDLSEKFEGYKYDLGKSTYRGEEVGEGGYVYAEPGMYEDVALLDIASMHPTSIHVLEAFGPYTENFFDLVRARLAIKRGDYAAARSMLDGKLSPYLTDEGDAKKLSYALKIVINIVYGLTSAKFENPFKDPRNIDNIVAKRGALFMIDLKHFVQERGFIAAHIKTDSIKIPNATPQIIEEVMEFGQEYGYTFEHEATNRPTSPRHILVESRHTGLPPEHSSSTRTCSRRSSPRSRSRSTTCVRRSRFRPLCISSSRKTRPWQPLRTRSSSSGRSDASAP